MSSGFPGSSWGLCDQAGKVLFMCKITNEPKDQNIQQTGCHLNCAEGMSTWPLCLDRECRVTSRKGERHPIPEPKRRA